MKINKKPSKISKFSSSIHHFSIINFNLHVIDDNRENWR
jgi:hypothetical protein